jgi:hypothetical protein
MRLPLVGLRIIAAAAAIGAAFAGLPSKAAAGDVTLGYIGANPDEFWSGGYAIDLDIGFFNITSFEAEYAHQGGETEDSKVDSFMASAFLTLPAGRLKPYGGLGFGVFREEIGPLSDTSTHGAFILGAKLSLGLLVVKSDYRWIHLPDDALIPYDGRWQVAAGIHF